MLAAVTRFNINMIAVAIGNRLLAVGCCCCCCCCCCCALTDCYMPRCCNHCFRSCRSRCCTPNSGCYCSSSRETGTDAGLSSLDSPTSVRSRCCAPSSHGCSPCFHSYNCCHIQRTRRYCRDRNHSLYCCCHRVDIVQPLRQRSSLQTP